MTTPTEALIAGARRHTWAWGAHSDRISANAVIETLATALEASLPRTVHTVAELDALPVGAVVLSDGFAYQNAGDSYWEGLGRGWESQQIDLPATVLYAPEVSA